MIRIQIDLINSRCIIFHSINKIGLISPFKINEIVKLHGNRSNRI